jgi:hypothetical protein
VKNSIILISVLLLAMPVSFPKEASSGNRKVSYSSSRSAKTKEPTKTDENVKAIAGLLVLGGIVLIVVLCRFNPSLHYGRINAKLMCPHCQNKGKVRTRLIKLKKGISGGKATAALLTGGWSMLATGLSRKERCTQAHCDNCRSTWTF